MFKLLNIFITFYKFSLFVNLLPEMIHFEQIWWIFF